MPSITESLMGIGDWSIVMSYDDWWFKELKWGRHLLFRWNGQLLPPCVILGRSVNRKRGMRYQGRLLPWWLGFENRGPLIRRAEFLSGRNQIWPADWSQPEPSGWVVVDDVAEVQIDLRKYDPRTTKQLPAKPGDRFRQRVDLERTVPGNGRLISRAVIGGKFTHPNLLMDGNFEESGRGWGPAISNVPETPNPFEIVRDAVYAKSGTNCLRVKLAQKQVLPNPKFFGGSTVGWGFGDDDWEVQGDLSLGWSIKHNGAPGLPTAYAFALAEPGSLAFARFDATPGETWRASCYSVCTPEADGSSQLSLVSIETEGAHRWTPSQTHNASDLGAEEWHLLKAEETITEETPWVSLGVQVQNHTIGTWAFGNFGLTRIGGNKARFPCLIGPLKHGRTYKWTEWMRSGTASTDGKARLVVEYRPSLEDLPLIVVKSGDLGPTDNRWEALEIEISLQPGYDRVDSYIEVEDVTTDYFYFDEGSVIDQDPETATEEVICSRIGAYTFDFTCPLGTENIASEVVAEPGGVGLRVAKVDRHRLADRFPSSADVFRELLVNPRTGKYILNPGHVTGGERLEFDWTVLNMPNLDAIMQLCRSGISLPYTEWKVDSEGRVHRGTANELFKVRENFIFGPNDLIFKQRPDPLRSIEDQISEVVAIGAERVWEDGRREVVTGTAYSDMDEILDFNNNPFDRSMLVEDSTIDDPDFAALYAEYARRQSLEQTVLSPTLSDFSMIGIFDVGDWLLYHDEENGIVDPDNERRFRGRVVRPKKFRAISRTMSGPFEVSLRYPDGTEVPIPSRMIVKEGEFSAKLELGDIPAEFAPHDQGGPTSDQFMKYLRYRASR